MSRMGTILASAVLLGATLVAQSSSQAVWVSLFNGKDLTGWKNNGAEKWVVDQGTILCESAANKYGYLTTLPPRCEPPRRPPGARPCINSKHTKRIQCKGGSMMVARKEPITRRELLRGAAAGMIGLAMRAGVEGARPSATIVRFSLVH